MKERWVPFIFVGVLLLALPIALRSLPVAIGIALLGLGLLILSVLGLDRASTFAMVCAFFLASWDRFVVPGIPILAPGDAMFVVAMVLALPRLFSHRFWVPPAFLIGSLIFVALAVLSCLNSSAPGESTYYAARVIITFIVLPAMVVWWSPRGKVLVALAVAYAAGVAVSTVAGLPDMGGWRNYGLSQHPNILGYTAALALALVPFLMRALPKQHRTWICLAVAGSAGAGIMTSGSRAALVVAIVLVVLYPAAERSVVAALAIVAAGVGAIVVVGQRVAEGGGGEDALSRLLGAGDVEGSNQARVEGVEQVFALAVQHPFIGNGFTFSDFLGHNAYVQIAAAAGFISLAALLLVLWSMTSTVFVHDNIHSRLVYPAIAVIVISPVSPNLTDRYMALLMGLSLTGVVAVHEAAQQRRRDEAERRSQSVLSGPAQSRLGAPGPAPLRSGLR